MSNTETAAKAAWSSPSNIALVKYWGKKGPQIPANPSISFTLDQAMTHTEAMLYPGNTSGDIDLDFYFEGQSNEAFALKLKDYLRKAAQPFSWLKDHKLEIRSSNSFPHSSGIASSASAFSALALCLCDLHEQISGEKMPEFFKTASNWARIGSGSACRSVYGGFNLWGLCNDFVNSSDEYAVNIDDVVHPVFKNFCDTILIIEKGKKAVSSTAGHALLKEHPFSFVRYATAFDNITRLKAILQSGDVGAFVQLVEYEALMLHALMMSSPTPFILMKPNTLSVIEKITDFRNQTGTQLLFTLDAGANVHLLNPFDENAKVQDFIQNELVGYCQNGLYLCNAVGKGPHKNGQ